MINRNFTLIWVSQALSDVASEMTSLALPLAVLAATRSPVDAALVATVVGIAQLVARLPSGLIADTFDRRMLMLLCDGGRAVIAVLLAAALATGHLTTALAAGAAAATALFSAVFAPAESGVMRASVPPERRREAITRNIVRSNMAIAVGPPLGGLLLALGAPLAFLVDAGSYLVSLALVWRVVYRHVARARSTEKASPRQQLRHTASELTLGFGWVFRRAEMVMLIVFAAYLNLLGRAIELLAAIGVSDDGAHPVSAGLVLTAAGVGGIGGGLCTGWVLRHLKPSAILGGIAGAWLALMPLASSGDQLISAVAVGLVVFSLPPIGSLVFLTITVETPAHLQGRVTAAVTLLAVSIAWAGPGIAGFLIAGVGPLTASITLAAPMAIPLLALTLSSRLRASVNKAGSSPPPVPDPAPTPVPDDVMAHAYADEAAPPLAPEETEESLLAAPERRTLTPWATALSLTSPHPRT